MSRYRLLMCLLLLVCTLLGTGCGGDEQSKAPQELKICSSLGQDMTELLVSGFIEENKLKVKPHITYLPGGTMEQRFAFIAQGGYDCWLGGTAEEYFTANEKGLLTSYASKEAYKVPAELSSRRNLWTSLYLNHIAIISNKQKLHNLGLYAPTTWNELLAPQLRDEIVLPSFSLGGCSFAMLTSIWQLRGKQEALAYASAFNKQHALQVPSVIEAANLVYNNKKALAIVPVDYALELEEKYPHLFATVPKDANRNMLTGVALLKGSQHENITQRFIDYLLGDTSSERLHAHGYKYVWPVKQYYQSRKRRNLVGKLQVPMDDLAWTSTYKSEIIRQWTEAK